MSNRDKNKKRNKKQKGVCGIYTFFFPAPGGRTGRPEKIERLFIWGQERQLPGLRNKNKLTMTQLQVYSNNVSFYYLFGYGVFLAVCVGTIGWILLDVFHQIQTWVNHYGDSIAGLENKIKEMEARYEVLCRESAKTKDETMEHVVYLTQQIICLEENFVKNVNRYMDSIAGLETKIKEMEARHEKEMIAMYEVLSRESVETKDEAMEHVGNLTQQIICLEENLTQLNSANNRNKKIMDTELAERKTEIAQIYSRIEQNGVLIGYRFDVNEKRIIPVIESATASILSGFSPYSTCDCYRVDQFKYLSNLTEINIMSMCMDFSMWVFDDIPLEVYSQWRNKAFMGNGRPDVDYVCKENDSRYFVLEREWMSYTNGVLTIRQPNIAYVHKMYFKNGVKQIHKQLKGMDIELKMPAELFDFVFRE